MTSQTRWFRNLHLALWITQVVLALSFLWAAGMKWFQPTDELATMWPWVAQVPVALVKFTGFVEVAGAIGLLLPIRSHPATRTSRVAAGVVVWMIGAGMFHLLRHEASGVGVNVGFAVLAAFIAWGRQQQAPGFSARCSTQD